MPPEKGQVNQATTNNAFTASTVFIAFSANTAYSAYTMAYMPTYQGQTEQVFLLAVQGNDGVLCGRASVPASCIAIWLKH